MARPRTLRRQIYEKCALLTLKRIPRKDEVVPIEDRMNDVWYGPGWRSYGTEGRGQKDFSFYSDPEYIFLLLNSWTVTSWTDIDKLIDARAIFEPKAIFDYHGGCGMSAVRLALEFPEATVYSHSEVDWHRDIAKKLADEFKCENVVPTKEIMKADLLLCQEVLEHFRDPFNEIKNLLYFVRPQQYLDGSSFGIDSPGHFNPFYEGPVCVKRTMAKRRLNQILRERGFVFDLRVKHFNAKPALWTKKELLDG